MNTAKILASLEELNKSNSSKYKLETLKKLASSDDGDLQSVFEYTYNRIKYTFGVTPRTVKEYNKVCEVNGDDIVPANDMLALLEDLASRKYTGYKALGMCNVFIQKHPEDAELFFKILDHDLKVNISEKTVNKVWKNLIPKPNYNRCAVLSKKLADKIVFPAYIQLKCDGTYRECSVHDGKVEFKTRSGEPYSNPILEDALKDLPNGYYTGEFTIGRADDPDANRSVGNGNINSDNPDFENIHFTIWDYLKDEEYNLTVKTPYSERLSNLRIALDDLRCDLVQIVPSYEVKTLDEALIMVSDFMNRGLEGGVLKDPRMEFKNGTSNQQLKIKLKVDADLRCTGFQLGTKGTKYENKNKVILFESDDGKIKGQCSGMTDAMVEEVTKNPDKYIGKIVAVQFNDLIKAEDHDYHALSHPRFQEFRDDKTDTDTFERVLQLRDMARSLA